MLLSAEVAQAVPQPCFSITRRKSNGIAELAVGVSVAVRRSTTSTLVTPTTLKSDQDGNWCMVCPGDETEFDVTYGMCVGGRNPNRTCESDSQCGGGTCGKTFTNQPLCGGTGATGGTGDVSSSISTVTDRTVAIYDSTSGKIIKNSGCTIDTLGKQTCAGGFASPDQSPANGLWGYLNRSGTPSCAGLGALNQWGQIDSSGGTTPRIDVCDQNSIYHRVPYTGTSVIVSNGVLVGDDTANAATYRALVDCVGAGKAVTFDDATNAWGCNTDLTTLSQQPAGPLGVDVATAPAALDCACVAINLALPMADLDTLSVVVTTADTGTAGVAGFGLYPFAGGAARFRSITGALTTTGVATITNTVDPPAAIPAGPYWFCAGLDTDAAEVRLAGVQAASGTAVPLRTQTLNCGAGYPPSSLTPANGTVANAHLPFLVLGDDP